ncbi:unnamed protein product, partial [Ectocarpus sp. 4 AP-2014]
MDIDVRDAARQDLQRSSSTSGSRGRIKVRGPRRRACLTRVLQR